LLEREINERLTSGAELFGNSPKERNGRSDVAFNIGGSLKLNEHINLPFTGGRDIVGDTKAHGLHRIEGLDEVNVDFICAAKIIR
jgi:hypothetical protein